MTLDELKALKTGARIVWQVGRVVQHGEVILVTAAEVRIRWQDGVEPRTSIYRYDKVSGVSLEPLSVAYGPRFHA